jgi:hypothetical protein
VACICVLSLLVDVRGRFHHVVLDSLIFWGVIGATGNSPAVSLHTYCMMRMLEARHGCYSGQLGAMIPRCVVIGDIFWIIGAAVKTPNRACDSLSHTGPQRIDWVTVSELQATLLHSYSII